MAKEIRPIVEALLFATPDPLSTRKMASIIGGCNGNDIRKVVLELQKEYDEQGRGFAIIEVAGGFQILSREDYSKYIRELHRAYAEARLSQAALETLAIIAYKQPVLRAEIEAIRGVQAGPLLRTLIERGLIKIVGRADTLGRPALYGTTSKFLERFMLKSLKELPAVETEEANAKGQVKDESVPADEEAETEAPPEQDESVEDTADAEPDQTLSEESADSESGIEEDAVPDAGGASQEETAAPGGELGDNGASETEEEPAGLEASPAGPVEIET